MIKNILVAAVILLGFVACNSSAKKKDKNTIGQKEMPKQTTPLEESMERGGMVYTDFCMQCHLASGQGVPGSFPPLALSDWLVDKRTESIYGVKYGQNGEIVVNGTSYNGVMVPMGLSDEEVADVMNYIMNSWGNTQEKMVTPEEVQAIAK